MIIKELMQTLFLYKSITYDVTLSSLIREQYELAKKGISPTESNELPIYEREAFVNLILADKKLETENPIGAIMRKNVQLNIPSI